MCDVTGGELAVVAVVIWAAVAGVVEWTCRPTGGVVSARMYRTVVNTSFTMNAYTLQQFMFITSIIMVAHPRSRRRDNDEGYKACVIPASSNFC